MQKALVQMNLQLTEVLTDVMGMTGQAIVRAIVAGERDPKALAQHRHGRVKASAAKIERALTGNWREEHLFVLAQALAMFDSLAQRILECDSKIEALLVPLGRHEAELAGPGKRLGKNAPQFDACAALARWAGVDLTRINGLSVTTVMTILSEIGPDLSRFASIKHFCSWLGLCPGTKISGSKLLSARTRRSANRVRQALKLAAMSLSRNDSALGAFYRRLCARMDKPRANTAVAHKLARMVYFMLTRGEAFVDQGQQHYEEQQRQRSIAALRRRASALGFQITPDTKRPENHAYFHAIFLERKTMFRLSVLLMSVPTVLLGLLPTFYEQKVVKAFHDVKKCRSGVKGRRSLSAATLDAAKAR
jgi:transposase